MRGGGARCDLVVAGGIGWNLGALFPRQDEIHRADDDDDDDQRRRFIILAGRGHSLARVVALRALPAVRSGTRPATGGSASSSSSEEEEEEEEEGGFGDRGRLEFGIIWQIGEEGPSSRARKKKLPSTDAMREY